jgi:hypothetical protein
MRQSQGAAVVDSSGSTDSNGCGMQARCSASSGGSGACQARTIDEPDARAKVTGVSRSEALRRLIEAGLTRAKS